MREIKFIVVHTAAAANAQGQPVYQSAEEIDRYHREHNGWKKIGYHSYIEKDGRERRDICRGDAEEGAHVGGFNANTLGVCVAGHGDYGDFLPAQRKVLIDRCVAWCRLYKLGASSVVGHRETALHGGHQVDKTCPGLKVNMELLRADIARELTRGIMSLEDRISRMERYAAEHDPKAWLEWVTKY